MELPGSVPQLVELTVNPLVENKQLDALLAAKKPKAKSRKNKRSPFCPRQQTAFGTTSAMAALIRPQMSSPVGGRLATFQLTEPDPHTTKAKGFDEEKLYKFQRNKCKLTYSGEIKKKLEEKHCVISYGSTLTLHSHQYKQKMNKEASEAITKEAFNVDLYNIKKNRRSTSSSRPPETQQLCRGEEFQNGIPDIQMQDNQEKGLYDLSGPRVCFYAHYDTPEVREVSLFLMELKDLLILGSSVWILTESSHLYKIATPILGQMYGEYKEIILQTKPTGVQDQDGEVQYDTISIDYSSGDDDKLTNYEFKSHIRQGEGSQTRGQQTDQSWQNNTEKLRKLYWKSTSNVKSEIMICHGVSEQFSNLELRILEIESAKMERSIPTGVQDQDGEVQYDTISIDYSSGDDDKLTNYEFKSHIRQGEGSQTRGQQTDQSWQNNTEKLRKLYWKSTSNVSCSTPWLPNAEETFGIEKQSLENLKL
ncbi:hypothetical protein BB561_003739 [Smittium simulii]|uniref:Uncharacterized protein n=1 Tax=Smittium simulii TaxID=133385 RepID=A0A2T9YJY4_9FUNG|nr:hypothetical protein BB561_003739 [Smittium simulii]